MKLLKFLGGMAIAGFLLSCPSDEDVAEQAGLEDIAVQREQDPEKRKEEERRREIDRKIEEIEAAINDDDLLVSLKFSTDKKRPGVKEIDQILNEYGREIARAYHPEGKKDFVPDVIFVGDVHVIYEEAAHKLVEHTAENGDIFLMEGEERGEKDLRDAMIGLLELERETGNLSTADEAYYGIIDSGNYYVHIRGLDGPEELFNRLTKAYYAFGSAYYALKYNAPDNPTEEQEKKIKLLKKVLPYMKLKTEELQFERDSEHFAPAIIEAVEDKDPGQIVFVYAGFMHQSSTWIRRRLEDREISYITMNFNWSEARRKFQELKEKGLAQLEQQKEGLDRDEKQRHEESLADAARIKASDLIMHLYTRSAYYHTFGTYEIDHTFSIPKRESGPKLSSFITIGDDHEETKIRYALKQKEDSDGPYIIIEEIR